MEAEREYYIAGGNDLAKAQAFIEARKSAFAEMDRVAKELGGEAVHNSRVIIGLVFPADPPSGWTRRGSVEGKPYYLPKKVSRSLKEAASKLASATVPSIHKFHALFSKEGGVMKEGSGLGMRVLYISWEYLGDKLLLSVPIGSDYQPDGSEPLKMSEYWSLKEQQPRAA